MYFSSFAQRKQTVYLNADSITITKEEYKTARDFEFSKEKIKTDTSTIYKLKSKRAYGFLDEKNKILLFSILDKLSTETTNINTKIFIHNFNRNEKRLKTAINNDCYWHYVENKHDNCTSFLLTNKPDTKKKNSRTFYDEKKLIHQLFFSFSEFEVNHVIIKPTGEFTIYYGTYDICHILDSDA